MSDRRKFLSQSLAVATPLALGACSVSENPKKTQKNINVNFNKTYKWKMVTTWPPNFPVLGEGCSLFARWIEQMSGGRLKIHVYGGGELVPALESFDAVSSGAVEMGNGSAYYWAGKVPAAQFFSSVPFGMSAQNMATWIMISGAQKLWNQLYEPFNLIPFHCGNTGVQMGGWYNRKIEAIQDFQGLKMRMPGLGAKVLRKAGGSPVLMAGGEIYTNLERGVIDATEWLGPYHDYKMGFHQIAKYYYYPGWHEQGTVLEMIANKKKFLDLPMDLQQILRAGIQQMNNWVLLQMENLNSEYLSKIKGESSVEMLSFPEEVLDKLRNLNEKTLWELVESDNSAKEIYEHYASFKKRIDRWHNVSEGAIMR